MKKTFELKDMPLLSEPNCRYHQLPDGSMVDVYAVNYACKVDIVNKKYVSNFDKYYKDCDLPTFNDLYANGTMPPEGTCIEKQFVVNPRKHFNLTDEDFDRIVKQFRKGGINVTREAIEHNYNAWLGDFKSGYRDEENGYHLFSPCGCNPLSFRASTLHKKCEDWQQTYIC